MNCWLVLTAALLAADPSPELSAAAARTRPSVVLLEILDAGGQKLGNGTGFLISADGRVVTNHHVIAPAHQVRAIFADGSKRAALGVLVQSETRDVAILQLEGAGGAPLELAASGPVPEGTRIYVVGSPMGLASTVSEGIVSASRRRLPEEFAERAKDLGEVIQITAAISPGSSGSPVLSMDGRVLGVAQSIIHGASNIGFAVPVDVVHELLAGVPANAVPKPFHPFPVKNAIASAVFVVVLVLGWVGFGVWSRKKKRRFDD